MDLYDQTPDRLILYIGFTGFDNSFEYCSQIVESCIEPYRGLPWGPQLQRCLRRPCRSAAVPMGRSRCREKYAGFFGKTCDYPVLADFSGNCGFWRMPPEVRHIVYLHLFAECTFHVNSTAHGGLSFGNRSRRDVKESVPCSYPRSSTTCLPLLLTCRNIFEEGVKVLYSSTRFIATSCIAAMQLFEGLDQSRGLPAIRELRLPIDMPKHPHTNWNARRDWHGLFRFLSTRMTGLRDLRLDLEIAQLTKNTILTESNEDGAEWIGPVVELARTANKNRRCTVRITLRFGLVNEHEDEKELEYCLDQNEDETHDLSDYPKGLITLVPNVQARQFGKRKSTTETKSIKLMTSLALKQLLVPFLCSRLVLASALLLAVPASSRRHDFWALSPSTVLSFELVPPVLTAVPLFSLLRSILSTQSINVPLIKPVLIFGFHPLTYCCSTDELKYCFDRTFSKEALQALFIFPCGYLDLLVFQAFKRYFSLSSPFATLDHQMSNALSATATPPATSVLSLLDP
ncbi:hypothetical protein K431DRAFT_349996 [Polychaeton citri CBS 116435]|uniref:DUF7730 domain-containing protein n=1 Tax=Polychaeton citri CBS 116435 TaxID=1314669 RepID=A0A9P4UJZ3_9PEZI|nr:hypothetical protein K431DRAFT_349996 [Polychaeton citri CBS 116435]